MSYPDPERLPEAEDVAAPISHIDPLRARRNGSDLLDALFPDEQLAPSLGTLCLGFPLGSWFTTKVAGLYSEAAACLWHRQQGRCGQEALALLPRPTGPRPIVA